MIRIPIVAVAALSFSCAFAQAQDSDQKFTLSHISVTGSSSVEVRPDVAVLRLGVVSEKPTAKEAEFDNASSSNSVIAALKALGIDPKDIQTSSLTLAPMMVEERDPKTHGVTKRTLTGYRASNQLSVRIHDVDKAGSIASRVVEMGANTYDGLYFDVSDYTDRVDEQRARAVSEAMRRAKLFAHGASMKLGRLLALNPAPDQNTSGMADLPTRKFDDGPRVVVIPVEPGRVQVGAQVIATWELVPE